MSRLWPFAARRTPECDPPGEARGVRSRGPRGGLALVRAPGGASTLPDRSIASIALRVGARWAKGRPDRSRDVVVEARAYVRVWMDPLEIHLD